MPLSLQQLHQLFSVITLYYNHIIFYRSPRYRIGVLDVSQWHRKMRLKSIARISEWEVEINQGITGIRNLGVPDKLEKANNGQYECVFR